MGYTTVRLALVAAGLALCTASWAGGATGEMLGNTCAGCHGTDGASNGPATPSIGGLHKEYITEKMKAYQSGSAASTVMGRIAKGYSAEEIAAMAEYFAAKKFVPARQSADAALAAKGKKVHEKACEKCHEDGGKKGDEAGLLAGQLKPYLEFTLADFRSGKSEMPKKMAKKVEELSDDDVAALMNYYASQK